MAAQDAMTREPAGHGSAFTSIVFEQLTNLNAQKALLGGAGHSRDSVKNASRPEEDADTLREIDVLMTAAKRMLEVNSRKQMFCAVHEIMANLLGSEHFAIYEKTGTMMRRVAFSGDRLRIPLTTAYLNDADDENAVNCSTLPEGHMGPERCLPLVFGHAIVGVLSVFDFLPQTNGMCTASAALMRFLQRCIGAGLVAFPPEPRRSEVVSGA